MFKKDQDEQTPSRQPQPTPAAPGRQQTAPRSGGSAIIGPSITVKGDVSGDEDLVIQGRVEGTVSLPQHNVTIGPTGKVTADIRGKMVIVEGEVNGELRAQEQIILRHSAKVEGSISAPRVALEDGAVFRGGIEMDSASKMNQENQPPKATAGSGNGRDKGTGTSTAPSGGTPGKSIPV
jgi:cytoskeletal protein CcmA (bactofilin family)